MKINIHTANIPCIWIILFFLMVTSAEEEDINKRPIWNIGHMVNSLSEVDSYLNKGANGIEFDIQFDEKGNAVYTHHGFPCDFLRKWWMSEEVDIYLDRMRELTTPGHDKFREELVLLFLDLKIGRLTPLALKRASKSLATKLTDIYWKKGKSGAQAYLVLALPSSRQIEFIENFMRTLKEDHVSFYNDKIGFTFFNNEDTKTINSALNSLHNTYHFWQGDGITNWLPRGYGRLKTILKVRNEEKSKYFDKVYWWTVDKMTTMREVLSLGVDAITTNYPDNLSAVLKELSKYLRLANIKDSPWEKHSGIRMIPVTHSSSCKSGLSKVQSLGRMWPKAFKMRPKHKL